MPSEVIVTTKVFTAATAGGNQDFDDSNLGGKTPKAVFIVCNYATSVGSVAANLVKSIGCTNGTAQWAIGVTSQDNIADTANSSIFLSTRCIQLLNPGLGTGYAAASWVNFHADGVRVNWNTTPPAGFQVQVTFFAGADFNASVQTFAPNTTNGGTNTITTTFRPTGVFTCGCERVVGGSTTSWLGMHMGICSDDNGTVKAETLSMSETSTRTEGQLYLWIPDGGLPEYSFGNMRNATRTYKLVYSAFGATGFTSTTTVITSLSTHVGIFIIGTGDRKTAVRVINTPTSAITQAYTGFGFKPQYLFTLSSMEDVIDDTVEGSAKSGGWGVCQAANPGVIQQHSMVFTDDWAAATIDANSYVTNTALEILNDDATVGISASLTSFDPDGFTLNYSNTKLSARKQLVFAIQAVSAATIVKSSTTTRGIRRGMLKGCIS